jgi:beta-mannanase
LKTRLFLIFLALLFVGIGFFSTGKAESTIASGAYVYGGVTHHAMLKDFIRKTGRTPAIIMWYEDWEHFHRFPARRLNYIRSKGAMPMLTWEAWDSKAGPNQPKYSLAAVIRGDFDPFIHRYAHRAAVYGKPFYLRLHHEENGFWYPWGCHVNGNQSGEQIKAWRHVYNIFKAEGAKNVKWVWSPNIEFLDDMAATFPGDDYVDYVALDGYNWGTTQPKKTWQRLSDIFGASYDKLASLSTKPVMIAETASAEIGGDKAAWILQGLLQDVPNRLPRVQAVIWFNENKETDWRVDSSDAALQAYRQVVSSPLYSGKAP